MSVWHEPIRCLPTKIAQRAVRHFKKEEEQEDEEQIIFCNLKFREPHWSPFLSYKRRSSSIYALTRRKRQFQENVIQLVFVYENGAAKKLNAK